MTGQASPKTGAAALVELFANFKGHSGYPHRRYALERLDGELVLRQTEVDAAVEAAMAELRGSRSRRDYCRQIKKLRWPLDSK